MRSGSIRIIVAAAFLILLTSAVYGLTFQVEVGAIAEMGAHQMSYRNATSGVQQFNLSAENMGSIGCQYRLKGVFHYGDTTEIRFSEPHALYPGEMATARLYFLPQNYTGPVNAEIHSNFCEQEEPVENVTYYQTGKHLVNGSLDSDTLEVDDERVRVRLPIENGRMLPKDVPAFWKSSSTEITNGTAEISYDPPIYNDQEKLNYTVLNSRGNVAGWTTIPLKVEPSYWDKIEQRLPRMLAVLLFYSLVLSTKLLYDRKRDK